MIEQYEIPQPSRKQVYADYSLVKMRVCSHDFRLTKLEQRNGVFQFRVRCVICGETQGDAIKHTELTLEQKASAFVWNPQSASSYYAESERLRREEMASLQQQCDFENAQSNKVWWEWYSEYLRSAVWQRRHQAVMRRARGICEACQIAAATQVHHLTYAHVGREPLFDLVAICTKCHEQITAWDKGGAQ